MSPFATSFIFPELPPIVLSFYNETATYFADEDIVNEVGMECVKKINELLDKVDTDSQCSSVGSRNYIITTMKDFEKASVNRIFRGLLLALIGIFAVNIVALSMQNFTMGVVRPDTNGQLLQLMIIAYDTQWHTAKAINKGLAMYGIRNGIITE